MEVDNIGLGEITTSTAYTNKVLISILNRSGNTDTVKVKLTNTPTQFIILSDGQSVTLEAQDGFVLPDITIEAGDTTFTAEVVAQ